MLGAPKPSQCPWAPQERYDHSHDCGDHSGNSWVPMRTIIWKQCKAEIVHGMEDDGCKEALSCAVIDPNSKDPDTDCTESPPRHPCWSATHLYQRYEMPYRAHQPQNNAGWQRVPPI